MESPALHCTDWLVEANELHSMLVLMQMSASRGRRLEPIPPLATLPMFDETQESAATSRRPRQALSAAGTTGSQQMCAGRRLRSLLRDKGRRKKKTLWLKCETFETWRATLISQRLWCEQYGFNSAMISVPAEVPNPSAAEQILTLREFCLL